MKKVINEAKSEKSIMGVGKYGLELSICHIILAMEVNEQHNPKYRKCWLQSGISETKNANISGFLIKGITREFGTIIDWFWRRRCQDSIGRF